VFETLSGADHDGSEIDTDRKKILFPNKGNFFFSASSQESKKKIANNSVSIKNSRLLYCRFCILYIAGLGTPNIHHLSPVLDYY
jgi:hypothetical protein